jgi:hypothetical protein
MSVLDEADFPYKFASDSGDSQPRGATDLRIEIIVVYVERYLFGHEAHFVPPITGIHLAAITPSSYQVRVIHEQVEPINFDTSADLIALTFLEELRLIDEQIGELDKEMASLLSKHQDAVQRLAEVPGLGVDSAQQIIAEVGPTAATFPSEKCLSSWVPARATTRARA